MMLEFLFAAIIGLVIYLLFFSKSSPPSYWEKNGIPFIDSSVVATDFEILLGKKSILHRDDYAYATLGSGKFCGMLETPEPVILVKDLELIKKITIKDFNHFVDRRDFFTVADDQGLLRKLLGMLKGSEWKDVRTTMSPTFTSGKIRRMMEHFNSVGKDWVEMIHSQAKQSSTGAAVIDVINTVNQYTVDVIGSAVFGMNTGTIRCPDAVFAKMARRVSEVGLVEFIKLNLSPRYPKLFKMLGIEALDMKSIGFFEKILRQSLEERRSGNVRRNDFQQLLIDAQRGELKNVGSDELSEFEKEATLDSNVSSNSKTNTRITLTDDMIVAQSILFFMAGFTSTSTFISFSAYMLAANPEIQEKLRKEVDTIVKDDGSVDFDELGTLVFMDMFVNEVLRHYPAAIRLERTCTTEYRDPETGLFVPKNGIVCIPINAIHHDPKYYTNPEKFNPENFSPANKAKRSPYSFLPFGMGPRNCIGLTDQYNDYLNLVTYFWKIKLHNFLIILQV